jgi:hypothetical protein
VQEDVVLSAKAVESTEARAATCTSAVLRQSPNLLERSTSPPGHLSFVMIVAAGLLVAGMGSLALIARALRKAPEGYEDEHGFHIVRNNAVSRVFPGSMTTKIRASRGLRRGQAQYQRSHG